MKNIKKNLLLTAAVLSAAAPLLNDQHIEQVEASPIGQNVIPVGTGVYPTEEGIDLPLVMEMLVQHPDYRYYRDNGLHQGGRVLMYLQRYKDTDTHYVYYYSPAVRYLQSNASKNGERPDKSIDEFARARLNALRVLDGGIYYPTRIIAEHQLRINVGQGATITARGGIGHHEVHHNKMLAPAKGVRNPRLNLNNNHNIRPYTVVPLIERAWTPENLILTSRGYPSRHQDTRYTRGSYDNWVELRGLGYMSNGGRLGNPYFPADGMRANGSQGFEDYPMYEFPWSRDDVRGGKELALHSETDEYTYQWAMRNGMAGLSRRNPHYEPSTDWAEARRQYEAKRSAMRILYNRYPSVRTNLSRAGYSNREAAIEALTVRFASLQSPPIEASHLVSVNFMRSNGLFRLGATAPTNERPGRAPIDTQVVRQRVYRGNTLLQTFEAGRALRPNRAPEVEPGERLRVETDVVIQNGWRHARFGVLEFNTNARQSTQLNRKGGGNIRMGGLGTNVFEHTFIVPEMEGAYDIRTNLDIPTYLRTSDVIPESGRHQGENRLNVIIDRGNFSSENVRLVDRNNKVVSNPVPGQEYKLRYAFKYTSVNGQDARRDTNLRVDYSIGREIVGESHVGREDSGAKRTATQRVRPEHGKTYTFETDYQMFETAQFDTTASLNVSESRYNQNSSDNAISNRWSSTYDLAVSNVRLLPTETVNTQEQTVTSLVQFDVNYNTPSGIGPIGQDVDFAVVVDGQLVEVTEHVRNGLNRNISVPVQVELDGESNREIEATVIANHKQNVYETDINTQANNVGQASAKVSNPTIESFTDNNRTESWTQHIETNRWSGDTVNYRTFEHGARRFLRFLSGDARQVSTRQVSEGYKIDAIRFRSRLTRQEEMGPNKDGWINLLEEEGYIRAGYGYELEVDVSYETNAFANGFPNETGTSGRWTRPRLTEPLLQDNVYIEMPDGQIRSVQGDGGTEGALRLKDKDGDASRTTWTFEIEGGESLGAETVGRFYIGENVEDGRYSLNVFTPRVRGVNGKMSTSSQVLEHLLYDSAPDLGINVIGASVDDISDHINR